jgi:hypothetical protein
MQPDEKQPIRSRRALAGESAVTDTAVGEERIFGWQPRDQPRPDDEQRESTNVDPPTPRPGVLSDGLGQPDKDAAARRHWINNPNA